MKNIEEIIRSHVNLSYSNSKGWLSVKCPICNDYKIRAAFKFDNGGDSCTYHCFNNHSCGGGYNPAETAGVMSNNFRKVLQGFNIPKDEYDELVFHNTLNVKEQFKQKLLFEYPSVKKLPLFCHNLKDNIETEFGSICEQYLIDRCIDPTAYNYYFTTLTPSKDWNYRLIIPAYYKNKLIYYSGRDVLDMHQLKYKHMSAPLSDILFNFDELFVHTNKPLFIFEGFFDGMSLCSKNFVSIQSSNLTREQLYFLSLSKRPKIIVPDMQNNGQELIQQGIYNNFSISFPTLKNCSDINEAVIKYGKLFVLKNIFDNVVSGDDAKLRLNMLKFGI